MYLHIDKRLPGQVRYFMTKNKDEPLMLVPDAVRKGVIFIGTKHPQGGEMHVGGTAFFVGIDRFPLETVFVYLVTAKHCIDDIKRLSEEGIADGKVYLRVNSTTALLPPIETEIGDWYYHPTEPGCVDVAVFPVRFKPVEWDIRFFGISRDETFVNSVIINREKIGPGDEVFIAGLFTKRAGKSKNIPIIRIGTIAAMSEEPVYPSWCHPDPMEAYLIEARSIGGLSGSPVFVNVGVDSTPRIETPTPHRGEGRFYLLGLIHGHWGFKIPDIDIESETQEDTNDAKKINSGIAMVVPATKIYEALLHPELAEMRSRIFEKEMKKHSDDAEPD